MMQHFTNMKMWLWQSTEQRKTEQMESQRRSMFLAQHMLLPWGHTNKRDKDGNTITKPTCIISYNQNMGGVDMMDQQLDAIDVLRKSYKWYKKLFLRLVMQCSLSAHKLYKLQGGKDDFLHFLLDVCTHLFINAPRLERPMSRTAVDSIARLTGRNHWPAQKRNSC